MERHISKLAVIQRENERWAEKRRLLLMRMGKEVDMVQECVTSRQPTLEIAFDETFRIVYMQREEENRGEAGRMSAILEESQGVSANLEESQGMSAQPEDEIEEEPPTITEETGEMDQCEGFLTT